MAIRTTVLSLLACAAIAGAGAEVARAEDGAAKRAPIDLQTTIESSPQAVWDVMMDFKNYGAWNRWVVRIDGEAGVGNTVRAYAPSGTALDLRITSIREPYESCWVDVTWFTHLGVGGWRCRAIEPSPDGRSVVFRNHFEYTGPFAAVLDHLTRDTLVKGMTLENESLKAYVESRR